MPFDERLLAGLGVMAAIVDRGSFVGAAEVLNLTQPGVSRAVARLEKRLGIRLFDRSTRAVQLTDDGQRFYQQVAPLLAGLEEATADAAGVGAAARGRLRVNVDPFFSRLVLGPKLGDFIAGYPHLQLDLFTRDSLGDMVAEGFDLAVRYGFPRTSSLVARKLSDTRILTVAAPAYLARCGWPRHPADLEGASHTCIDFRDPDTGRPYRWEFHRRRERLCISPPNRLTVNDAGTLLSVCLSGHAVAQVMAWCVGDLLADGSLVTLFPEWQDERFPLYAYYPSRQYQPAKVRVFLDFVIALARGQNVKE